MRANEIHRVQDLNMRDTGNGSPERIHDDLRTVEVDEAAVTRVQCDHLVFSDVAGDEHRQAVREKQCSDHSTVLSSAVDH